MKNQSCIDNAKLIWLKETVQVVSRGVFLLFILLPIYSNTYAKEYRVYFNIPKTTLESALADFADQANVQVMFASNEDLNQTLVSLKGHYNPSDAIAILLVNTGFEYIQGDNAKTFAVRPIQLAVTDNLINGSMIFAQYNADSAGSPKETGDNSDKLMLVQAYEPGSDAQEKRSGRYFSGQRVEEIIVTAQKREQNIQDVGVSITAFSETRLRELQLTDPIDLAGQTPGLNIRFTDGNTNPIINIRGIGLNDNNSNNNPSTAVHIDDVYLSSSAYLSFPLFDLQRVEVLKGPQGTLFGRNTTGGSVNFYTRKPTQVREGYIDALIGNFEAFRIEGAVGGAMTDTLSARLSFVTIQSEGHQTNIGTIEAGTAGTNTFGSPFPDNPSTERSKHGVDNVKAIRLALDWNPSERFNVLLSTHVLYDDSDNWIQRLSGPDNFGFVQTGDENTVSSEFSPSRNAEGFGFVLKTTTDLETMQVITITGYESYDRVSVIDLSGPSRFFTRDQDEELWQFTQEVRLQSDASDRLFWTVGGYYSDDEVDSSNGLVFGESVSRFGATTLLTSYVQTGESFALFGHTEYQLREGLRLVGGLRFTDEKKTYDGGSSDPDPFGLSTGRVSVLPPGGIGLQVSKKYSATDLSGKIGLDWIPKEDVLIYTSFSKGFKSGGFDGSTLTSSPIEADPFNEETVLAYELGFKSLLFDQRLQLNGAAFYYDYNDLQVSLRAALTADVQGTTRVNAGDARIWGLELEVVAYPVDGLMLLGGLSYLDTKVTNVSDKVARESQFPLGNVVPDAPEISFNFAARYERPLTDTIGFSVVLDATYKDDFFANINNDPRLSPDSYVLFNAKTSLNYNENWEFSFWVRNLLDNEYVISKDLVTTSSQHPFETYGKPRTYGIGVRYQF